MTRREKICKISLSLAALVIGVTTVLLSPPANAQLTCNVVDCEIGGKSCHCCLLVPEGLFCAPCGDFHCPPAN